MFYKALGFFILPNPLFRSDNALVGRAKERGALVLNFQHLTDTMDEVGKIIDEIKQVVFLKLAVALPDWEEESDLPPHWSSVLSYMEDPLFWEYEDLIFSDSDVYDIMERVAGKYGWKRWKPANEDEAMLYACMHYYESPDWSFREGWKVRAVLRKILHARKPECPGF
jgi:hypothetical protein